MFAMLLAAALGVPPDGTYTYTMERGGSKLLSSQVVFARTAGGLQVHEHTDLQGGITTTHTFDATLRELDYVAQTPAIQAEVALARDKATLTVGGSSQDFALPDGIPTLVVDGLFSTAAVLPSVVAANHLTKFTMFTTRNPQALDVTVDQNVSPVRPDGVPAADNSLTITLAGSQQTMWFDPATHVVDEFDPTAGVRVRLTSRRADTLQFTPAPMRTPFASRFRSSNVQFVSKDGTTLAGTVSYPEGGGPFPGVILIQGSGVSDRNETVGPNQVFAELADALNARGYAVLRYDKRLKQVARSGAVEDGLAATSFMRATPNVNPARVYFLGHSEGGEIVLGIALAGAPLRGVIMLAPLPMNYTAMLERQIARNHISGAMLTSLRDSEHEPYMASFNGVDPLAEVRSVRLPMLLVHGSEDRHVTDDDLRAFIVAAKSAHPISFSDVEIPGDTHLFARLVPAQAAAAVDETTSVPLDPRLIDALVAWLSSH